MKTLAVTATIALVLVAVSTTAIAWRVTHPNDRQRFDEYLYATCIVRSMALGIPNPSSPFDTPVEPTVHDLAKRCLPPARP